MINKWCWFRLGDFPPALLLDYLRLRAAVFVVEQACLYADIDDLDSISWHLLGLNEAGRVLAGLRLVPPGLKYPEPSLGRVVLDPAVRGAGLGCDLVLAGLQESARRWPGQGNRISAQSRLQHFYARCGFLRTGPEYLEDGIPHIEMHWPAP